MCSMYDELYEILYHHMVVFMAHIIFIIIMKSFINILPRHIADILNSAIDLAIAWSIMCHCAYPIYSHKFTEPTRIVMVKASYVRANHNRSNKIFHESNEEEMSLFHFKSWRTWTFASWRKNIERGKKEQIDMMKGCKCARRRRRRITIS